MGRCSQALSCFARLMVYPQLICGVPESGTSTQALRSLLPRQSAQLSNCCVVVGLPQNKKACLGRRSWPKSADLIEPSIVSCWLPSLVGGPGKLGKQHETIQAGSSSAETEAWCVDTVLSHTGARPSSTSSSTCCGSASGWCNSARSTRGRVDGAKKRIRDRIDARTLPPSAAMSGCSTR